MILSLRSPLLTPLPSATATPCRPATASPTTSSTSNPLGVGLKLRDSEGLMGFAEATGAWR